MSSNDNRFDSAMSLHLPSNNQLPSSAIAIRAHHTTATPDDPWSRINTRVRFIFRSAETTTKLALHSSAVTRLLRINTPNGPPPQSLILVMPPTHRKATIHKA